MESGAAGRERICGVTLLVYLAKNHPLIARRDLGLVLVVGKSLTTTACIEIREPYYEFLKKVRLSLSLAASQFFLLLLQVFSLWSVCIKASKSTNRV